MLPGLSHALDANGKADGGTLGGFSKELQDLVRMPRQGHCRLIHDAREANGSRRRVGKGAVYWAQLWVLRIFGTGFCSAGS